MNLILSVALLAPAADPCVSGIPVGKRPGPYSFLVATGPQRGQPTCYVCEQHEGGKPAAVVFARTLTPQLGKLLAALDAEAVARKDSGFKAWMTLVTPTADLNDLGKWAQNRGLKNLPVGAFEGTDGPPAYRLAADADVTVMLFAKEKVTANFAFRTGELTDAKVKDVVKALPPLFEKK